MSTDTRAANEEILAFLEIYSGRTSVDPEDIYTVVTMRDGGEVAATLRVSDLNQILAERREAIELLAASHRGDSVYTTVGDFLAGVESDA